MFISIGQNVFANKLAEDLAQSLPNLDPNIVLQTGATSLQKTISPADLPLVLLAYNNAITRVFRVSTGVAGFESYWSFGVGVEEH